MELPRHRKLSDLEDKLVGNHDQVKNLSERDASIARVRAERRCGELLKETVKHGGDRKSKSNGSTLKPKTLSE